MAQQRCEGLDVNILLQDYRDLNDQYDRIVSVGMFEHVGPKTTPPISTWSTATSSLTACSCCIPSAR